MKTTAQVYAQYNRIFNLSYSNTSKRINEAHPATGGSHHLCHNWGNEEATRHLEIHRGRTFKLQAIYQKCYDKAFKAEYPNHLRSKSIA